MGQKCRNRCRTPARGKPTKVVITAVMRKLLLLAWTLLRTGNHSRRLITSRSPVLDSQDGIPTTELASCASGAIAG